MWYTATVLIAYGTGAGYDGAPSGRYTTVSATAMSRSPKAALRQARRLAEQVQPCREDLPGSEDWYWIPVLVQSRLMRSDGRLIAEVV